MGRELRRLLITPERLAATVASAPAAAAAAAAAGGSPSEGWQAPLRLEKAERHYLERVLRLRAGERVALIDGCGGLWTAVLEPGGELLLEQHPAAPLQREPPPRPQLELALAVPRRDPELVWRMATELGLDRLQPLQAERCVPAGQLPLARWRALVVEACEQCERLWQPQLADSVAALAWFAAEPPTCSAAASAGSSRLLATTRRPGLPLLADLLAARPAEGGPLSLAVGPEGGWSPAEEEAALAAGWQPVSLGPLILRSATAAVAAAAQLAAWRSREAG